MDYSFKVTTHGRAVLAACMAKEAPPKITRVSFGSGKVAEDVNLADVHELIQYVASGTFGNRQHQDDRFSFEIQYENISHPDITTVFYMSEFMVFIQDPETGEETDLIYGTLGDYIQTIPPYRATYPAAVWTLPLTIILSSDLEVSIDAPAGLVTFQDLYKAVAEAGSAPVLNLTVPANGWVADGNGVRLDLAIDSVVETDIPFVVFSRESQQTVDNCGMGPWVEAGDGVLRFWATVAPSEPISATVLLFVPQGAMSFSVTGSGGSIPVASANRVGGIMGSDSIIIDEDGRAHAVLSDENFVTEEEVAEAMQDVFGEQP